MKPNHWIKVASVAILSSTTVYAAPGILKADQTLQPRGVVLTDWFSSIVDNGCDLATLGECGRQRDRERARKEEAIAREKAEAEQRLFKAKLKNLYDRAEDHYQQFKSLKEIISFQPDIANTLDLFVTVASKAREERIRQASTLSSAAGLLNGSDKDLRAITALIEGVRPGESNAESARRFVQDWTDSMKALTKIANSRNEQLQDYIQEAIQSSNGETLDLFISEATTLRSYIVDIREKINVEIERQADAYLDFFQQAAAMCNSTNC